MLGMCLDNPLNSVKLMQSLSVMSIHPDHVEFTTKSPEGATIEHQIPTNFVLWSTGIAMNPFTHRVSTLLPNQVHRKAIEVDAHLRVKGAPLGEVYAIGDCATVSPSLNIELVGTHGFCRSRRRLSAICWNWWMMLIEIKTERLISMSGKS